MIPLIPAKAGTQAFWVLGGLDKSGRLKVDYEKHLGPRLRGDEREWAGSVEPGLSASKRDFGDL